MNMKAFFVVWFGSMAAISTTLAAATAASSASGATMTVDGVACGPVLNWEGGDPRGSVVRIPLAGTASAIKSIGAMTVAPLVVRLSFPLPGPIQNWIADFFDGHQRLFARAYMQQVTDM